MDLQHRRRFIRAAVTVTTLTALLAAAAGCSKVVDGQATGEGPAAGGAAVPTGTMAWGECAPRDDIDIDLPADTECGTLTVPVDYAKPDGDTAQLALIRFPATGAKIGSLLVNPGGPGEPGVDTAMYMVNDLPGDIREQYDFVGFDPRGVGASEPAVWCNSDAENDRLRADPMVDYSEAGVERINAETEAFVQRCVDKMGLEFLANVGTVSVAKDLDALRAALGDEKLNYLGYSYGTRIGATYIELFPQNVGRIILDGAIDPNADPVESNIEQAQAFQEAFNDFAADCATSPDCPLGTDPDKALDVYRSLVDPLVAKPAITDDPRNLAYSDAIVATIMALYSPGFWQYLTQGLEELTRDRGDTLLILADMYMQRDDQGRYSNATDARVAVNCVDEPPITDPEIVVEEDRRYREVAPFMSYGTFTGFAPMPTCSFWPVPPTSEPHVVSVPDLAPTLVVSVTGDPATPYQAGVDLAEQLGGGLITVEATQHTAVFQSDACVDGYAVDYLINGTLPADGATC
ncbi:MAG: alpha/beta hydrolase [Mycobacterium sp.]